MTRDALVIMAKAPLPGLVKTRVGLPPGEAAELYRAFLRDLIRRHSGRTYDLIVAVYPGEMHEAFGRQFQVATVPQRGSDLGESMLYAFREAFRGHDHAALAGSDTPQLHPRLVRESLRRLGDHDLVLGPSLDGGYYLVAAGRELPLFDRVPWSTDKVLSATVLRAATLGLRFSLLPPLRDIDTFEDLVASLPELNVEETPDTCREIQRLRNRYADRFAVCP